MSYQPPYTISPKIILLISEISEKLGQLSVWDKVAQLRLHRINHIRTIQGSLAIEGNTLSETQITAILEGKTVLAPAREIQEVRNATLAYEQLKYWQSDNENDLLQAHQRLMTGLMDDIGRYRSGNVGVMKGKQVIHLAPPADRISVLMNDLLLWLAQTDHHPLIVSCVFHYEFEFIHPFSDGNGRMGRLWQTLILGQWNPLLAQIPVENLVFQHQQAYYNAINKSTLASDSQIFIEFILTMILQAIKETLNTQGTPQDNPQATPQVSPQVERLLTLMQTQEKAMNREELQQAMGLVDRKSFRRAYLKPALIAQLIAMTLPDKPSSSRQQYILTQYGHHFINNTLRVKK